MEYRVPGMCMFWEVFIQGQSGWDFRDWRLKLWRLWSGTALEWSLAFEFQLALLHAVWPTAIQLHSSCLSCLKQDSQHLQTEIWEFGYYGKGPLMLPWMVAITACVENGFFILFSIPNMHIWNHSDEYFFWYGLQWVWHGYSVSQSLPIKPVVLWLFLFLCRY